MKSKSIAFLSVPSFRRSCGASLVLFISALSADAVTYTWVGGGGDAKSSTNANWDVPYASNGDAIFNASGASGTSVDWDSGNIFSLTFGAAAPAYTFTSTAGMQFNQANAGTIVNNSANLQTFNSTVRVFFNGSKTFNAGAVAGGGLALTTVNFRGDAMSSGQVNTLTLTGTNNGSISGVINPVAIPTGVSTALTKTGTGTWTLSGANTFTGNVTVSAGTLKAGVASVPDVSGAFGLNTAVTTANVATAILDLNGFNTQIGSLAGGGTTGGNVTLGSATLTTGGNNTNTTYAGVISNGSLAKIGSGVQSLSGANLYAGGTAINGGSLSFLNTSAKPASGTVTVAAGATIGLGVGAAAPQFVVADVDSLFAGTLPGVTNDIASNVGIDTAAGSITYGSSTPANTRGLTKLGGNVLTLTGTNLHTGPTTLSVGTLSVGTTENLGNANPLIFDGGNLQITGTALTSYASGAISGHPVTLISGKTVGFDINDVTNIFTASEILNQGSGGLLKAGAGTLKLTAANPFTGVVSLNAGSLIATDPAALGTSRIVFAAATTKLSLLIDGGGTISLPNSIGSSSGFTTTIDVNNNGSGTNGVIQLNGGSANSALGTGTINVTGANGYSLYIANIRSTAGSAGATNFVPTTASLTLGNLTGTQATGTNTWTLLGTNANNAVTGVISNGGAAVGAVQKSHSGTWTLSGANTYTGKTQIFNGILNAASLNSVVSGSSSSNLGAPVTVPLGTIDLGSATATGNLNYTGGGETTDRVINLGGTTGGGEITQSGASGLLKFTSDFTATVNGAKTLTLSGSTAGTGEISGAIVNSTLATSLVKTGSGTWTLSGANTFTGSTTVSAGVLNLSGNRTVSSVNYTVGNTPATTATLNISDGTFATGTFVVGTVADNTIAGIVNQSGGNLTLGGNQLLIGNGGGTTVGSSSTGTYNLSNGTLNTIAGTLGVVIGVNHGTTGVFNLSGTGNLSMPATSTLQIARSDGSAASNVTGTFSQTAGTAIVGILRMGGLNANNIGANATLSLTGGTFSAVTFNVLSASDGSTSAITVGGTAQVTLPAFPTARGSGSTATITFDGGTLSPTAADGAYMVGLTNAYLTANGAKLNVDTGNDITISQVLENAPSQTGTLTKLGTGTLTLTGANTYSGSTTVEDGVLSISNTVLSDTATLAIGTVAASPAVLNLPNAGTDIVGSLVIDGVIQPDDLYDSTNSGGAITGLGKIQVGAASNTYANWLTSNSPATGFSTDTDNDGVPNGLENVLGSNPNTYSAGLTQVSATANSVTYQHTLNPTIASDVTYIYQWSSDLTEWKASGVANTAGTIGTIVASAPVANVVTVTTTRSGTASSKLFTRIKAENP